MRHSTITLTMDTYGHLFPGQEAETISRLPKMMAATSRRKSAAQGAAHAVPFGAIPCDLVR